MYRALNQPLELRYGAAAAAALRALAEIYAEAGLLMAAWAEAQGIGCPPGCGLCCDAFVPDVLPIEAEYLALHLLSSQRAAVALLLAEPSGPAPARCPFYDPSSAGHRPFKRRQHLKRDCIKASDCHDEFSKEWRHLTL